MGFVEEAFAENLKYYREKCSLTQKQLALRIGLSEKSVSKWENGGGLPTAEVLIALSRIFGVSVDDILLGIGGKNAYLGVHGNASKTTFLLCDEEGSILRRLERGSLSPNEIEIDNVKEQIEAAIDDIRAGIPKNRICAHFGIAGWVNEAGEELTNFIQNLGFMHASAGTDLEDVTAISLEKSGIVAVMDMGFVAYAVEGSHRHRVGGWGQLFDEGGSAYSVGRDAVLAVLRYRDGSGRSTSIAKYAEQKIGQKMTSHISELYNKGKRYIASFSDCAFAAYDEEDSIASEIVENNVRVASQKILSAAAFVSNRPIKVVLTGILTEHENVILPIMKHMLSESKFDIHILHDDPVFGAATLAGRLDGIENLFEKKQSE